MATALSRRSLFGRLRGGPPQQRPPWARSEEEFTDTCTRCGVCLESCPTGILVVGHAGYPIVDFSIGSCTFCGSCTASCPVDCFDTSKAEPWPIKAHINTSCIETRGVTCRVCEDACEQQAIRFRPRLGGGAIGSVTETSCTGCGGCVLVCPVNAISVGQANPDGARS